MANMAELYDEDSSDGTLVIDEKNLIPNDDDSVSDQLQIAKIDKFIKISSFMTTSSSTIRNIACTFCSKLFSCNDDLLNHIKLFKGKCLTISNDIPCTKRQTNEDLTPEHFVKKKRGRPPKNSIAIDMPIPKAIPVHPPPLIPLSVLRTFAMPPPIVKNLPSLRQQLIDEMEPEYPCSLCDQIFRHHIGLLCHLDSDHKNDSTEKVENIRKKTTRKIAIKEKKPIENDEPISDIINLTLMPDVKKDSLLNRMKSYVYSASKGQVLCVICNAPFKTTKKALAHVEDKHIKEKIQCGYCNMKFVYELKVRSHMAKRHNVIGVYKCDKCLTMLNKEECETHSEKCKNTINPIIKQEDTNVQTVEN